MNTGLSLIVCGFIDFCFGVVTIWPWQLGSALSSWVCIGVGAIIVIWGIIELNKGRKHE
jgi:hypothetical protein